MFFWKQIPFVRLLLPFLLGLILQWHFPLKNLSLFLLLIIALSGFLLYTFLPAGWQYSGRFSTGLFTAMLFTAIGALSFNRGDIYQNKNWLGNRPTLPPMLVLKTETAWADRARSMRVTCSIVYPNRTTGHVYLYTSKDSTLLNNPPGSYVLCNRKPSRLPERIGTSSFNPRKKGWVNGITHQVFLSKKEIRFLPTTDPHPLKTLIFFIQKQVIQRLHENMPGEKERGLALALLMGYKDELDPAITQDYARTGVVHIIAISGLHLGLIYSLLMTLFKPLKKSWLRGLLVMLGLWLFAFLAGGAPSVLRSAVMFSCILLGEILNRKSVVYNSLAFSALILLVYRPGWLGEIGFQLSYAAVLSILIFYKPVYRLLFVPNKWLDKVWQLASVTLAAQILTTPLCLYHFQQFPVWFLPANLVAVPLAGWILMSVIGLCTFSFLPIPLDIFWDLLTLSIRFMNNWIRFINQWPFAVLEGIHITATQVACLYGMIMLAGIRFVRRE